ncbi:MAG: TonB-dependent receptor plug domain-containing protein, partial [Acidimicrobiia bacterium]
LRLDWQRSARNAITVEGDALRSVAARKDFRPMASAPFSLTNLEQEVTHAGHVLARWNRRLNMKSSWALQIYWDHVQRTGDHGFVDLRWDTLDLDFQQQFQMTEGQTIVYGAGYRSIDAFLGPSTEDNGFAVSFPPPYRHLHLMSGFAQDQISLMEDTFSLTLGSKFEHNDFTGFEYQPTGRLLWTPTGRQAVWAAVSRAVRTPTLSEDGIGTRQIPSFPPAMGGAPLFGQLTGSPDFRSEEVLAYELGYRAQITDTLAFDLAVFHNLYDKLRVVVPRGATPGAVPGTFDLPLSFQNRMKGQTSGAEVAATWQPTERWRLYGAYSFLDMQLRVDPGFPTSAEVAEAQSPRHQVYLHSSWKVLQPLE